MMERTDEVGGLDDWRAAFVAAGTWRTLAPGEVLVHEGEDSDHVFLVVDGDVDVLLVRDATEAVVARCPRGELVGEMAALAGTTRSATIRAASTADVVVLERSAFVDWLAAHPEQAAVVAAQARHHLHNVQVTEMAIDVLGAAARPLVPELLALAEWVDVGAGETLFREGDEPDAAYFVLSGRLQVVRRVDDLRRGGQPDGADDEEILGEIGRGEVVGESAVLLQVPRSATVRALRDTTLARFDLRGFEQLLTRHPQLMLLIVRRMVRRIAGERTAFVSARSVAVIVTADVTGRAGPDLAPLLDAMVAELGAHGSSMFLSSDRVDAQLGRDGIAQVPSTDIRSARLDQFLAELEVSREYLLLLADREPSEWTRRVLQRADCIVVIASATPGVDERRLVGELVDACAETRSPRWLVLLHPPGAPRPIGTRSFPCRDRFDEVHHIRRGSVEDLARVTRLAMGVGYGVVLGGGGARGFAHLGVLRALRDRGVPVDRVGGASMGSIFAAGAALYRDQDELARVCAEQFDGLLDYTIPVVALLKAKRISANLNAVFGGVDAEDMWLPFYCVSTNLTRSRLEVHRRGNLATAVRASIAIPGVLPPVPFGTDLLVDGGVMNNVPADVMRADPSIGTVIAVDVAPKIGPSATVDYGMYLSGWQALRRMAARAGTPYPGVASVLVRTMITGSEGRRAQIRADGTADLYLDLDITGVGLLEFGAFATVVQQGYDLSAARIDEWLADRPAAALARIR